MFIIPGHAPLLHVCDWVGNPGQGVCDVHVRVLDWVPSPQLAEQDVHAVHVDQTLTAKEKWMKEYQNFDPVVQCHRLHFEFSISNDATLISTPISSTKCSFLNDSFILKIPFSKTKIFKTSSYLTRKLLPLSCLKHLNVESKH